METQRGIRLGSLNIHGWRDGKGKLNRHRILSLLKDLNADVVALQEVKFPFPLSKTKTSKEEIEKERIVAIKFQEKASIVGFDTSMPLHELQESICLQIGLPGGTEFTLTTRDSADSISLQQLREDPNCEYGSRPKRYELRVTSSSLSPPPAATSSVNNEEQLEFLANSLGMEFRFQPALDETFGNAILWKKLFLQVSPLKQDIIKIGGTETRSFLALSISIDGSPLTICNTHFDDRKEETRSQQAHRLMSHLDKEHPHVIVGDLNALRQHDYTAKQVEDIAAKREAARRNIEPPKFDLLTELEQSEHYTSGIPFAKTCEHETRIDYVLLSKECAARFTILEPRTISTEASDHALLSVALQKK